MKPIFSTLEISLEHNTIWIFLVHLIWKLYDASSSKLLMVWILMKNNIINFLWNFEHGLVSRIFFQFFGLSSGLRFLVWHGKVEIWKKCKYNLISHSKVKFNVNRIDNIIIQRVSLFNTNIFCSSASNDILFLNNIFMKFFRDGKKCYWRCPIYTFMWLRNLFMWIWVGVFVFSTILFFGSMYFDLSCIILWRSDSFLIYVNILIMVEFVGWPDVSCGVVQSVVQLLLWNINGLWFICWGWQGMVFMAFFKDGKNCQWWLHIC